MFLYCAFFILSCIFSVYVSFLFSLSTFFLWCGSVVSPMESRVIFYWVFAPSFISLHHVMLHIFTPRYFTLFCFNLHMPRVLLSNVTINLVHGLPFVLVHSISGFRYMPVLASQGCFLYGSFYNFLKVYHSVHFHIVRRSIFYSSVQVRKYLESSTFMRLVLYFVLIYTSHLYILLGIFV